MKYIIFISIFICNISFADNIQYEAFDKKTGELVAGGATENWTKKDFEAYVYQHKGLKINENDYRYEMTNLSAIKQDKEDKKRKIEQAKERLKKINPELITDSVVKDLVLSIQ